jgi:ribosome-binding factor A
MGLRKQRLADEIRDVVASLFQGGQLDDANLNQVTISAVKLSADLQVASIYFRVYPGADVGLCQKALKRASGLLRKRIADCVEMRRVPELRFFYDESIEYGSRIEELLRIANTK